MTRNQKILFYGGMVLLVLSVVELASLLFLELRSEAFTFFDPRAYVLSAQQIEAIRPAYDAQLGWQDHFATPLGERPREIDYPRSLLATFGDSYTFCDQVRADQTWQAYLARELHQNVFNFGARGYGTDQAYLRFLRDYPRVGTPLVSLGLVAENINRIVSVYRKFYYPKTGIPATKPRFILEPGGLRLIENPIARAADLIRLRDPAFVATLGRYDHWYNPSELPVRAFPFSAILFNRAFWRELRHGSLGRQISDLDPRPWAHLWQQAEPRRLMFALLDHFERQARAYGAIPIFVVLAKQQEVRYRVVTGRHPEPLRILLAHLRQRGYNVFDAAQALAAEAGSAAQAKAFYNGHLNPRGNRLVAAHLRRYLNSQGWLNPPL